LYTRYAALPHLQAEKVGRGKGSPPGWGYRKKRTEILGTAHVLHLNGLEH